MPDTKLRTLAAQLWDLRGQCEHKLRSLTDAQRLVDEYVSGTDRGTVVQRRLVSDLDEVVRLDAVAMDIAKACRELAASLGSDPPQ